MFDEQLRFLSGPNRPSLFKSDSRVVSMQYQGLSNEVRLNYSIMKRSGCLSEKSASTVAADMAGEQIDRLADRTATLVEQAARKRRLINGPREFRKIRTDHPS
jgi:hypothetical protein